MRSEQEHQKLLDRLKIMKPRMQDTFKRPKVVPSEKEYDRMKQKRMLKRELSEEVRMMARLLNKGE